MPAAPLYRADPPSARIAVAAEGMTLLYHRPSGTTHVLLPPAPEILAVLGDGPADPATVTARLVQAYGVAETEGDEPVAAIVAARLDELEAVGLVARA